MGTAIYELVKLGEIALKAKEDDWMLSPGTKVEFAAVECKECDNLSINVLLIASREDCENGVTLTDRISREEFNSADCAACIKRMIQSFDVGLKAGAMTKYGITRRKS